MKIISKLNATPVVLRAKYFCVMVQELRAAVIEAFGVITSQTPHQTPGRVSRCGGMHKYQGQLIHE
jgi:hypothetical protein